MKNPSEFYELLKKVQDSYERGLSCAIEQNREDRRIIQDLQRKLLTAHQMNQYFNKKLSKQNINSYVDLWKLLNNNTKFHS